MDPPYKIDHSLTETHTKPPRAIFDLLHEAEAANIPLPMAVQKWWKAETRKDQNDMDARYEADQHRRERHEASVNIHNRKWQ